MVLFFNRAKAQPEAEAKTEINASSQIEDRYVVQMKMERENWVAFDALAREAEPGALAAAPAFLADLVAAHERDVEAYRFECRRFGDFLSVFIERLRYQRASGKLALEKFNTSLNLGKTNTIRLRPGHAPDSAGRLVYHARLRNKSGSASIGWTYGDRSPPMPCGDQTREVVPYYPRDNGDREIVHSVDRSASPTRHRRLEDECPQARYRTDNYPRAAEDDVIYFEGTGTSIHVPAGLGEGVLAKIMAEITSGAPPVAMPTASATP